MSVHRVGGAVFVFGLVAFVLGCGGDVELGTVSGKVTLGGKALSNATVTFTPENGGRPSMGFTDEDGYYELRFTGKEDGALVGKHKVTISTYEESDGKVTSPERVPAQYNVETTLVKEVESGSNEIDFPLEETGNIIEPDSDANPGQDTQPDTCGGGWEEFDDMYDDN